MTSTLQLEMGLSSAHRNRYLFSDHYLNHILPADPRWDEALSDAADRLTWLQDLYTEEQEQLRHYNEDQLRDHWFTPILSSLGHAFEREASVPGLDAYAKRPDYVFFASQTARRRAVSLQNQEEYATEALAVGEVKRWETPLGKKRKGGGPTFEDRNPSWQIDYYVRTTGLDWGILSNGRLWRLVHRDSSHRLQIYYEVDLVQLLKEADAERLRYFTLFFRQAAFRPDTRGQVFLDDALAASNQYAVELEEDLEDNVYRALERVMQGFLDLPTNELGREDLRQVYDNSLLLLYRLLFILYGESRGLLPLENEHYRASYSLTSIKEEIAELGYPLPPRGRKYWGYLQNLFHIINGDDAELNRSLGVPRYNGGLFDPEQHPFLEEKAVGDRALVEAIDLVSRRETGAGREFADYRTLGVRHLGSIYEGLLEYQPRIADEPVVAIRERGDERWVRASDAPDDARVIERRAAGEVYLETDRGERKATGSYYTPQYIVEYIVEHTIGPLTQEAVERVKEQAKEAEIPRQSSGQALIEGVLNLKVLDPAMGSGHFLVEATEFLALALATDPYVETVETAEEDLTYWKRRVVERCIYGVDKNPLAVELAKLSLWLATVAVDRPLSFLDHHLKCGDSLIGARVEDLGWAPPPVLSKKAQKHVEQQKAGQINMFEHVLSQMLPTVMGRILEITEEESRDYATVRAKEAADQAVRELKAPFEAVADLWTSAYFGNDFAQGDYDEALGVISRPGTLLELQPVSRAREMAEERRFFHWELAFPEVFYDENGQRLGERAGFDAVVGNPPYVRVQRIEYDYSDYLFEHYVTCHRKIDLSVAFLERALWLMEGGGLAGLISSSQWLATDYGEAARRFMGEGRVVKIIDFGSLPVFESVSTYAAIFIITNAVRDVLLYAKVDAKGDLNLEGLEGLSLRKREYDRLDGRSWILGRVDLRRSLGDNEKTSPLSRWGHFFVGALTGCDEVFVVSDQVIRQFDLEQELLIRYAYRGEEIDRYSRVEPTARVIYPYTPGDEGESLLIAESRLQAGYPNTHRYLQLHKDVLSERRDSRRYYAQGYTWFRFLRPGRFDYIAPEKLLIRGVATESCVGILPEGTAFNGANCPGFIADGGDIELPYLLALLNSQVISQYLTQVCPAKLQGHTRFNANNLNRVPIRRIEFTTPADERERLAGEGITEAAEWIKGAENGSVESVSFSAFSGSSFGRWLDERFSAEPEQSDVVHDLLAHLAELMMAMHQEKQERVDAFWLDLEGVTDAETFRALKEHGKWESSLWKAEACRPFVAEESRSTRHLHESLGWNEGCFKAFVKMLAGRVPHLSQVVAVYRKHHPEYRSLVARIEATDRLIDLIVYRLYGLTEEEVAVVEGG